jgi:hypothetical protein
MIDASRPITSASRITEPRTCRRDAPTVRSVANSRVRCATVIESVLKITKAPTNSAMPANVSRKYRMMFVNVVTSAESSLACSVPDRTVTDVPSSLRMRATSSSGATPSCAAACTESSSPSLSRSAWAVGTSKMANVAPPSELTSPYLAIPTISYSRAGPRAATPIRSPTARFSSSATPSSIATSLAPDGQLPSTRLSGLNRSYSAAVSMPNANDGAPPVSIGSPSGLSSLVWGSVTEPVATSTPSTARTCSRAFSGIGGASDCSPSKLMSAPLPLTTASVPAYDSTKIALNALSIVSVSTYAPLIIATPRTIAIAVSTVRNLRPARPRSATPIIATRSLRPSRAPGVRRRRAAP